MLNHALEYLAKGWSVIPTQGGKKVPAIAAWEQYQNRLPTEQEIREWWSRWPNANIAVVTGRISNIVAVDFDAKKDENGDAILDEHGNKILPDYQEWPQTLQASTPSGGIHNIYQYLDGIRNIQNFGNSIDVRGEGGYVIVAPSKTEKGPYTWVNDLEPAPLPLELYNRIFRTGEAAPSIASRQPFQLTEAVGIAEGKGRHAILHKAACSLLNRYREAETWFLLERINRTYQPPMSDHDLQHLFDSARRFVGQRVPPESSPDNIPRLDVRPWREFDQIKFPENPFVIEDLIPAGCLTIIAAPSGEKKSWVGLEMARCIAAGVLFAEHFQATRKNVLYIEQETPQHDIQRRGRQLKIDRIEEGIYLLSQDALSLNSDATVSVLLDFVREKNIEVIFVDTFRSVAGGLHEEKAEEVRAFFARFKPWKDKGIAMVFLDHCRKPRQFESAQVPRKDQIMGSQDKVAAVEVVHMMRSKERSEEIRFYPTKSKVGREIDPFKLLLTDSQEAGSTVTSIAYGGTIDEKQLKSDEAKELICGYLIEAEERKTAKSIQEALRGQAGKTAIENALKELREDNEIGSEKDGKSFIYWMPKEPGSSAAEGEDLPGSVLGSSLSAPE